MRNGLGLIDLSATEDETGMKGGVALKRESADISYRRETYRILVARNGREDDDLVQVEDSMIVVMSSIGVWQQSM